LCSLASVSDAIGVKHLVAQFGLLLTPTMFGIELLTLRPPSLVMRTRFYVGTLVAIYSNTDVRTILARVLCTYLVASAIRTFYKLKGELSLRSLCSLDGSAQHGWTKEFLVHGPGQGKGTCMSGKPIQP
jgi:hypothetical protein